MEDIMITARGLVKTYNGQSAVGGIDFHVKKGDVFGIIGPNGAGKTTTLKMISGLIPPTSGQVLINDQLVTVDNIQIKKIIGYLPEESPLYENMKTRDYLRFFASVHDVGKKEADIRINTLLNHLNLEENNKRLGTFSKGMKRKVAIARSLINDPQLLIYDEPTSGLDPQTAHYILGFIKTMKERGKTVIFSAHNLAQVESICDRVLIMKLGGSVANGSINELKEQYGTTIHSITYQSEGLSQILTISNMDEINRAVKDIMDGGGVITDISVTESDLEEIFLKLIEVVDSAPA